MSGLALANSLGVMFEVLVLLFVLRQRWRGIQENLLAATLIKALAASLVMAAAIVGVDMLWSTVVTGGGLRLTSARIALEGLVGLAVFLLVAALLRMRELTELWGMIKRRSAITG